MTLCSPLCVPASLGTLAVDTQSLVELVTVVSPTWWEPPVWRTRRRESREEVGHRDPRRGERDYTPASEKVDESGLQGPKVNLDGSEGPTRGDWLESSRASDCRGYSEGLPGYLWRCAYESRCAETVHAGRHGVVGVRPWSCGGSRPSCRPRTERVVSDPGALHRDSSPELPSVGGFTRAP